MGFELAVTGDSIINRPVSFATDDGFLALVDRLRAADVAFTHLEALCHDYDDPGVVPAAVSGGTWVRAPKSTGDELAWAGIDLVSHASNHALDYSYGGLRETWRALDDAGVAHAGTGENLAAAREPAYVDTPQARVGLVSMTASFPPWSRAGSARTDLRGRPGVNPLGQQFAVDDDTFEAVRDLGTALGYVVVETDDAVTLTDPASRNMVTRFERSLDEGSGARRVLDERDREGNIRAVEAASAGADLVVAHVHTHEFRPGGSIEQEPGGGSGQRTGGDIGQPPAFVESFARDLVGAGADVVVCQGSHAPTRGIEVYDGAPILYDPGEFFLMANTVTRQPADFYEAHADRLDGHPADASPADGLRARGFELPWEGSGFADEDAMVSPRGGFFTGPGSVLVRCRFDGSLRPESVVLEPVTWRSEPRSMTGVPVPATGAQATAILEHVAEQSAQYGTAVAVEDGRGTIEF